MTDAELKDITRNIDSLVIVALNEEELRRKLGLLTKHGSPNWQLLRQPTLVNSFLIAVVVKPSAKQ